jgi:hypothetical protein
MLNTHAQPAMPTPTGDAGARVTVPPGNAVIGEGSVGWLAVGCMVGWLIGWQVGLMVQEALRQCKMLLHNTQCLHPWGTLMHG